MTNSCPREAKDTARPADWWGMDVVLLSLAMVTVIGAALTVAVIIPARRRGATLVNHHTLHRLTGQAPARPARRRRNNVFVQRRAAQQHLDLTVLLSQGVGLETGRSRRSLTRAS